MTPAASPSFVRTFTLWLGLSLMLLAACGGGGGADESAGDASLTAPVDLQVTPGNASAALSFTVTTPRADVLFHATCIAGNSQVTVSMVSHATGIEQMQVADLTNDLAYSCTVTVSDASGASAVSQAVPVTPTAAATAQAPTAPTDVQAAAADTSAIVSFSAPVATVLWYTVTCQGTELNAYSSGTASPIPVPGLSNGQRYVCSVVATNIVGDSPASAQVEVTPVAPATPPAARPDTPTVLGAMPSDGALSVAFTPPAGIALQATYRATCSATGIAVTAESSASPVFVSGLQNGAPYTCSVTVSTAAGTSNPSATVGATPRTVPDAPRGISATSGSGTATVTFEAPSWNGGATIQGYQVRCQAEQHEARVDTASAGTVVVAGLANGTAYGCSVTARNDAGSGPASTPSMEVTPLASVPVPGAEPAPVAPSLIGVSAGNALAIVDFAPGAPDASILDYTATCTTRDLPKASASATKAASPITVSGLYNNRLYDCIVTARNQSGDSPASPSLEATPRPANPQAPELLYAVPANASAVLRFTPRPDNGSPILHYDASCGDRSVVGSGSPITVDGLTNGQLYACTVTATNEVGPSESSNALPVRPLTTPDPVQELAAQPGDGSVTLSFSPPASNGGGELSPYSASCTDGKGTSTSVLAASSSVRSIAIVGLSNGVSYTCTVTATNGAGNSTASLVAIPNASLPAAPTYTLSDTIIGDGTLSFKFGKPASNLSDVSYAIDCRQTTTQSPVTPSSLSLATNPFSASLTGLQNGSSYTCTATATNSKGSVAVSASAVPNSAPPTAPGYVTGNTVIGDGTLSFSFSKSTYDAGDVSYAASCKNDLTGIAVDATVKLDTDPFIVSLTGLTNGSSYTCTATATNSLGWVSASASATPNIAPATPTYTASNTVIGDATLSFAFGKPSSNGSDVVYTASCKKTGTDISVAATVNLDVNPFTASLTGLTNGSSYTCTATARNSRSSASTSAAATPNKAPAAPTYDAGNTGIGDGTLIFKFGKPADNGADTVYSASCKKTDTSVGVTATISTGTNPFTASLNGLTNGSSYTCTAVATNSKESASTSANATPNKAAPAAPTYDAINTVIGDRTLSFKFGKPANNGADTVYSASCTKTAIVSADTSSFTASLSGLTNGTSYTCTAVAANSKGQTSTSASATTYTAPTAPTVLAEGQGSSVGNQTATVAFVASSSSGDTSSSLSYTATCTNVTDATDEKSTTGSASPLVVSALTNGASYLCSVTAKNNNASVSSPSATVTLSPYTTPGAPGFSLSVIPAPASVDDADAGSYSSANNAQLRASLTAPASNGGRTISQYGVTCTAAGKTTVSATASSASTLTLTGMPNNASYTCAAIAHNAAGDSAAATQVAVTAITQPGALNLTTAVVCSRNNIHAGYSYPTYNGGASISTYHFTLYLDSDHNTAVSTQTSKSSAGTIDFASLSYSTRYYLVMRAVNSVGSGPATTFTLTTAAALAASPDCVL